MRGSLDVELTRRCNLRCDYCFVGWSRDWHTDMPEDTALRIVEEGSGLFPVLHLTGGEPFAYRALFEVIEAGLRGSYEEILINTNGTWLTPEVTGRLASYGPRVSISVSLDGPESVHDAVRGKGRYREASEGLGRALALGVRAAVMTVVTPAVLRVLAAFVDELFTAHPALAGLTLFPVGVGPKGSQKPGSDLRDLTPDELKELALTVALLYRLARRPVGIGAYPMVNPLLLAFGYPEAMLYQCTAGRGRVCVHADLSVSSCHPVKEAVYGAYHPGLLGSLSSHDAHRRMAARDYDGCRSCDHQETCGHCRVYVAASGQAFFGNDEVCLDVLPDRARNRLSDTDAATAGRKRIALPMLGRDR